jgi:hypothetical protein
MNISKMAKIFDSSKEDFPRQDRNIFAFWEINQKIVRKMSPARG